MIWLFQASQRDLTMLTMTMLTVYIFWDLLPHQYWFIIDQQDFCSFAAYFCFVFGILSAQNKIQRHISLSLSHVFFSPLKLFLVMMGKEGSSLNTQFQIFKGNQQGAPSLSPIF